MNRPHPQNVHPTVVKQQYDPHNVWNFEHKWTQELCDCKPMSRCCFACFCPWCMGCKLASRLGESSILGCCPGSAQYYRTKLRTARRIEGNCCSDTCITMWCAPCSATQMAKELEMQGLWETSKKHKTHPRNDHYNQHSGDY